MYLFWLIYCDFSIFIYLLTNLVYFFLKFLVLVYFLCNIFTIHICLLLMCCCQFVVMCLSVCDCNLNVYIWGPQTMRTHSSLRFIYLGIRKKKLFLIFFFRKYNLYFKKTLNPFKVVYHPVSCLLHLHVYDKLTELSQCNCTE